MNREIRFRAWSEKTKQMADPFGPRRGGTILWRSALETAVSYRSLIDSDVLMQYTGLLDKNGKEIYEGDVIEFNLEDGTKEYGTVRWSKDGFWTTQKEGMHEELLSDELNTNAYEYKVVGNSFENPEILKQ